MNFLVWAFIATGFFFFVGTTVGLFRFPDFYSRMHAAGKGDTVGAIFMLLGIALFNLGPFSWQAVLISLKILLILVFLFLANPTATHAIIDAGFETGAKPWTREGAERKEE